MKEVRVKDISIGGGAGFVLIAGPCVIEDEDTVFRTLDGLVEVTEALGIPFVFKASYDKANRTSIDSFRGPGLERGLEILDKAKKRGGVPVLTDVHCRKDVAAVAGVADIIQIPAMLSRQTDLIVEAARTGKPVNIKKGQFSAPHDMRHAVQKVLSTGNDRVILTERGTSFGYNNLVVDFRSLPILRGLGHPVIFDATHSVQRPAGLGDSSGGDRAMIRFLARAAVAVGVDGIFMEVHPDPERAKSDGPNSVALGDVKGLLRELKGLDDYIRSKAVV